MPLISMVSELTPGHSARVAQVGGNLIPWTPIANSLLRVPLVAHSSSMRNAVFTRKGARASAKPTETFTDEMSPGPSSTEESKDKGDLFAAFKKGFNFDVGDELNKAVNYFADGG